MVLGAQPEGEAESHLRASWVRFAAVGDPERSYIEFPDQIWAFVRRGGYSAFAVADAGVRPGVLLDLLDQALMMGEQDRARDREAMRVPDMPSAPSGKPRTSLHKQEREATRPVQAPPEVTSPGSPEVAASDEARAGSDPSESGSDPDAHASGIEPDDRPDPEADASEPVQGREDEPEVDRILLAKEFAGLLQVPKEDDEAST
jgi:hypothetical protein